MTGLEKIIERIQTEARERAGMMLQNAEKESTELAKDYAARSEQARARIEKEGLETAQAILDAARAETEKAHTEILQSMRTKLIDEAFARAKQEICGTDFGKYRELLAALLVSALLEQHRAEQQSIAFGDEVEPVARFEVLLNAADRERFGSQIITDARRTVERRIGAEKAGRIALAEEAAEISGGLILRFGDVELNCTLEVLMADIRRELTPRVTEILFGERA